MIFAAGIATGIALSVLILVGFLSFATHTATTHRHKYADTDSLSVARDTTHHRGRRARDPAGPT